MSDVWSAGADDSSLLWGSEDGPGSAPMPGSDVLTAANLFVEGFTPHSVSVYRSKGLQI